MKIIKTILIVSIPVAIVLLSLNSCKSSTKGTSESDTTVIEKDSLMSEVKEVVYPLPSPFQLYQKLEDIGAKYVGKVLNPIENIDKYYTEKNKALNLGTYSADLSYITTYNKTQDIQLYSKNVKTLISDLNININFQDFYTEETKEKLENKDSLVAYITNVFYSTYKSMAESGDPSLAALMVTGIWAEGLFIATHISNDTYNNTEIVKIIFDQKKSLDIVLDLLKKYSGDELVDGYIKGLENIKSLYDQAGDSLTKEQLEEISNAIENIRSSIIS